MVGEHFKYALFIQLGNVFDSIRVESTHFYSSLQLSPRLLSSSPKYREINYPPKTAFLRKSMSLLSRKGKGRL